MQNNINSPLSSLGKRMTFVIAAFGFIILFVCAYFALLFFGGIKGMPDTTNLIKWDAFYYHSIKENGYSHYWYMASNSAFFPFFSYLWRLLHLNAVGISIFNLSLFLYSIYLLYSTFSINIKYVLIFISLPAAIFFYVPYTESLFFFFCTLFLIGLAKDNLKLIFIGLLLASITRATALFFVPAILFMEVLSSPKPFINKKLIVNCVVMSLASILGLLIVVLIQHYQTGVWFAFVKQQFRFWQHKLDIPGFPLVAHGGDNALWIDGIAFILGLQATALAVGLLIKKFITKKTSSLFSNKPVLFTIPYLIMITVYSLFYNAKSFDAQTSLNSFNRYMFCNPFFFIFISFLPQIVPLSLKNYFFFVLSVLVGFFLIGLNGDPLTFFLQEKTPLTFTLLFFFVFFVYINLFLFSCYKFGKSSPHMILFSINLILSVYCYNNFINGGYVG